MANFTIKADLSAEEVKKAITEYVEKQTGMKVAKVTLNEYYDAVSDVVTVELQKRTDDSNYFMR